MAQMSCPPMPGGNKRKGMSATIRAYAQRLVDYVHFGDIEEAGFYVHMKEMDMGQSITGWMLADVLEWECDMPTRMALRIAGCDPIEGDSMEDIDDEECIEDDIEPDSGGED